MTSGIARGTVGERVIFLYRQKDSFRVNAGKADVDRRWQTIRLVSIQAVRRSPYGLLKVPLDFSALFKRGGGFFLAKFRRQREPGD